MTDKDDDKPEIKVVDMNRMPGGSALGALLADIVFGGGRGRADHPLLNQEEKFPWRAASIEEFFAFMNGITKFEVGDIVTVRDDIAPNIKWPTEAKFAIVTQVLKEPRHFGDTAGSHETAAAMDVALLFAENFDVEVDAAFAAEEGREPKKPILLEFLWDSRRLKKVGNAFKDSDKIKGMFNVR